MADLSGVGEPRRRPLGEQCRKCRFFQLDDDADNLKLFGMNGVISDEQIGTCRRHAPRAPVNTIEYLSENRQWADWPTVNSYDWCGDHLESFSS